MVDALSVFSIAGAIITIGFLGNLLFKRTKFPDIIFLLLIGIILGPILNIFPRETLLPVIPFFTTLALMMILFDGGLNLSLYKVLSQSVRATILAVIYVALVSIAVTFVAKFLLNIQWLEAVMFGPLIAGTSSVVIIPLMLRLNVDPNVASTLTLESTITDVLNVVLLLAFLEIYLTGAVSLQVSLSKIASEFAIGIFLGFIIGIFWIKILVHTRKQEYTYMLTIAALFIVYSITQSLGGNGALAALIFGLLLGNERDMIRILRMKIAPNALNSIKFFIKKFQGEISFLIRAFFFVFLGLIYDITGVPLLTGILYGAIFTFVDIVLRYISVHIATYKSPLSAFKKIMTFICGQGLAHATLSIIVYQKLVEQGVSYASLFPVIVVNVIILTNIITSISSVTNKIKK